MPDSKERKGRTGQELEKWTILVTSLFLEMPSISSAETSREGPSDVPQKMRLTTLSASSGIDDIPNRAPASTNPSIGVISIL